MPSNNTKYNLMGLTQKTCVAGGQKGSNNSEEAVTTGPRDSATICNQKSKGKGRPDEQFKLP